MTDTTTTTDAPMTLEQRLEALPGDVKAEFLRLRLWVETCIGAEIAKVGGKHVQE